MRQVFSAPLNFDRKKEHGNFKTIPYCWYSSNQKRFLSISCLLEVFKLVILMLLQLTITAC